MVLENGKLIGRDPVNIVVRRIRDQLIRESYP